MARLDDGFSTTITFSADTGVVFEEKTITPPGIEAGGANDTTTMLNTAWRTKSPKKLKTATDSSLTCAYDPATHDEIAAMIGVNQLITINWPDGATLAFWGWIDVLSYNEVVEGEQPTLTMTIIASNQNASLVEVAPAFTAAP